MIMTTIYARPKNALNPKQCPINRLRSVRQFHREPRVAVEEAIAVNEMQSQKSFPKGKVKPAGCSSCETSTGKFLLFDAAPQGMTTTRAPHQRNLAAFSIQVSKDTPKRLLPPIAPPLGEPIP